jgi:hypothetical protein
LWAFAAQKIYAEIGRKLAVDAVAEGTCSRA